MIGIDWKKLADFLEEPVHLVVWREEVVAVVRDDAFGDAFPLPAVVQGAAAEMSWVMRCELAMRLELASLPGEFWDGLEEERVGENLQLSRVGRSGEKYLLMFRGLEGSDEDLEALKGMGLVEKERLSLTRWVREQGLVGWRRGDFLMKILEEIL